MLCILVSAVLGLLVTLSTFLAIGATSTLTFFVVGNVKTAGVIVGGVLIYNDVRLSLDDALAPRFLFSDMHALHL